MSQRTVSRNLVLKSLLLLPALLVVMGTSTVRSETDAAKLLEAISMRRGICALLGLPPDTSSSVIVDVARGSDLMVYFQSADDAEVKAVRDAASAAGLLGSKIFAGEGDLDEILLADNILGAIWVSPKVRVAESELLRALHPGGRAIVGEVTIIKPGFDDVDSWSHPYHRADNNPQSLDRRARAPYLTQFLADPKFCPMPEISVAAGGKVYRAFGHIAHKANQNAMLNTLICVNAYNGTILWKRKLSEGFMIHRNTLVATPEYLYLADHESCKRLSPETGEIVDEIKIPAGLADGAVWKWMALEGDILYALIGGAEVSISTRPSKKPGLGHWPWGMWDGHDYKNPRTNFGFGRHLVAIDTKTKRILWKHAEKDFIDSRGTCMKGGRLYFYSPEKFLACLDTTKGELLWKTSEPDLLEAVGKNGRAQHYVTGYATTTYIKCSDDVLFFAGPHRARLVAASAKDGKFLWSRNGGNLQLVLRGDGLYAAGPSQSGVRLQPSTGEVLANLPTRRACTRATGSIDSIFYRTTGGTVRFDVEAGAARHIAPMRPPCQDGVIISDGYLYWGPWMCGCQLSLYGHIALGPAGDFDYRGPKPAERLETYASEPFVGEPASEKDWPTYMRDSARRGISSVAVPKSVKMSWSYELPENSFPTAPIAVGDAVFFADRSGAVYSLDAKGELRWKAYVGASVYFPPDYEAGRLFVGSADGWVYALEARSGRRLWRFRLAPRERRIPVYGRLISTWPVSGGLATDGGIVYAAAGIAHYDGTQVVALDAASGKPRWLNTTSGRLSSEADSGVSLQGSVSLQGAELHFAGGGIYKVARYERETGRCINEPFDGVTSRHQTAFYPYFPQYGEFLSYRREYPNGRTLLYQASYEGSKHSDFAMLEPASANADTQKAQEDRAPRGASKERRRRGAAWSRRGERYNAIISGAGGVLTAGQRGATSFLAAIDDEAGKVIWERELKSPVVKGGIALDRHGQIIVSLLNHRIECYESSD